MGPADASASVPATTYQSTLPGTQNDYLKRTDVPRNSASVPSMPKTALTTSDDSDARGVIKSIDRKSGKVKLKHGPIKRLDMPGMTMVFRVKDPALLEQVSKGDTVGFTVDVEGSAFYVTGFQK
jgi:Cu/Ag efflux protein CusF